MPSSRRVELISLFRWVLVTLFSFGAHWGIPNHAYAQDRATTNFIHFDIDGRRFRLADYVTIDGEFPPLPDREGPVVIIFGAHWCNPCHEVVEYLHQRRTDLEELGIHVVYVHVDDVDRSEERSREQIAALVEEMASGPEFEGVDVLLGGDMDEVRHWVDDPSFESLPGIVLIAANGTIYQRLEGTDGFEAAFEVFWVAVGSN